MKRMRAARGREIVYSILAMVMEVDDDRGFWLCVSTSSCLAREINFEAMEKKQQSRAIQRRTDGKRIEMDRTSLEFHTLSIVGLACSKADFQLMRLPRKWSLAGRMAFLFC